MNARLECITNLVPDLRSCLMKGAHRSNCDGYERRYDRDTGQTALVYRIEWNPLTRENDRWLIDCTGCLPRPATTGRLCSAHHMKLEHALERDDRGERVVVDLVTHLWSIESGGVRDDNDRVSSAYGSRWPLSESHILANGIFTELVSVSLAIAKDLTVDEPQFSPASIMVDGFLVGMSVDVVGVLTRRLVEWIDEYADTAIKHKRSAEAIVRMIGVVQTAMNKFPLVESDHRVPFVRCAGCSRMTLTWKPPLMNLDDVLIKCERCGHEETQDWLEFYIEAVKTDPRRRA